MLKLKQAKKITLATLKAFAKRNIDNIYSLEKSSFNGMVDMVTSNENLIGLKVKSSNDTNYYRTGIDGVYTVGQSRDMFNIYEDDIYFGIEIYNCCGTTYLAIKK